MTSKGSFANWNFCEDVFPMMIALDKDNRIIRLSDSIKTFLPDNTLDNHILDTFKLVRPRVVDGEINPAEWRGRLILMLSLNQEFAFRAQLVDGIMNDKSCYFLIGSPWVGWLKQHAPEIVLDSHLFPIHDAQLEQEFYISTQQSMVDDLETLNEELQIARDVARSADETKSQFVSHMSHELRTPLNGVVSAMNLLLKQELSQEAVKLVDIAKYSSDSLLTTINEVLDFSKLGSGNVEIESVRFSPNKLAENTALMLSTRASDKKIDIATHLDPKAPAFAKGDADKMRQILVNFAGNAIKFSQGGTIEISTRASAVPNKDQFMTLRFEVKDQGRGIAAENHRHVFEPFWAKSAGLAGNEASTGLGLSICQKLALAMDGTIGFDSIPGIGSTFWFQVTLEVDTLGEQIAEENDDSEAPQDAHFQGNVLLVDDNQVNLTLGTMLLQNIGLNVRCASDGEEAVEKATQGNYDLVFMDITMPIMDGVEATQKIREIKTLQYLPIVALTANVSEQDKLRYLKAGMNDCLIKPIVEKELLRVARSYLVESGRKEQTPMANSQDQAEDQVILDEPVLAKLLKDIGPKNLQIVSKQFLQETDTRMEAIHQAYAANDTLLLGREAHALGSSVLGFGAAEFGHALRALEKQAKREKMQSIDSVMASINDQHRDALDAVRHYMEANVVQK